MLIQRRGAFIPENALGWFWLWGRDCNRQSGSGNRDRAQTSVAAHRLAGACRIDRV